MKHLLLIILSLLGFTTFAQMAMNPVSWNATYVDLKNDEAEIIYTATIEPKWHIYSQTINGEGPIPTNFLISTSKDFQLIGIVGEEGAHEIYDNSFDIKLNVFDNKAVFKQKIKRINTRVFKIKARVEFMTCNDMQCLPPKIVELEVMVPQLK